MIKHIIYKKENGDVSERDVFIISKPSKSFLTLDLTELSEVSKKEVNSILEAITKQYMESIKDIGLSGNFRNFREDRIVDGI